MFALRDRGALTTGTGQPAAPGTPAATEPAAAH